MAAAIHSNPSGAKSLNGMLPKTHPAKCYSANAASDKILIVGPYTKNWYLFESTRKSNHENTKLKKHENYFIILSCFRDELTGCRLCFTPVTICPLWVD
jgi:hypothetical protein